MFEADIGVTYMGSIECGRAETHAGDDQD